MKHASEWKNKSENVTPEEAKTIPAEAIIGLEDNELDEASGGSGLVTATPGGNGSYFPGKNRKPILS